MKLNNNRYYQIKSLAWKFLINSKVKEYPLNLSQVIDFNGWKKVSYQELGITSKKKSEVIFTQKNIIIFFDAKTHRQTLRLYLAHEIGHIVLKHYNLQKTSIYESEARQFARLILMPTTVIHNLKLFTEEKLVEIFDITHNEAKRCLARYYRTLKGYEDVDKHPLELKLKQQLRL